MFYKINKVVRDKVPELLHKAGCKYIITKPIGTPAKKELMVKTVCEKAKELLDGDISPHSIDLLADLTELIDSLRDICRIPESMLEDRIKKKRREKGKYVDMKMITDIDDERDPEEDA